MEPVGFPGNPPTLGIRLRTFNWEWFHETEKYLCFSEVIRHPLLILWRSVSQDPSKPSQLWKESLYSLLVKVGVCSKVVLKHVETTLEFGGWVKKTHRHICCDSNCREWTVFKCCTTSWPYNKTCGNKVAYTFKSWTHILISKDLFVKNISKWPQKSSKIKIKSIHSFNQQQKDPTAHDSKDEFAHTLAIRSSESFSIPPGKPKNFLSGSRPQRGRMVNGHPTFPDPRGPLWPRPAVWSRLGLTIGFP